MVAGQMVFLSVVNWLGDAARNAHGIALRGLSARGSADTKRETPAFSTGTRQRRLASPVYERQGCASR